MAQKQDRLNPGELFHIYNRGNNRQTVFRCDADYDMFLQKWERFIVPVASTLAYNLLPNHFHAIVRISDEEVPIPPMRPITLSVAKVEQAFANFFNSFSRSMHNEYGTDGAVFKRPYRRKLIATSEYLQDGISYVLLNAFLHGFVQDFRDHPYSSFVTLGSNERCFIDWATVLELFGGQKSFLDFLLERQRNKAFTDDLGVDDVI